MASPARWTPPPAPPPDRAAMLAQAQRVADSNPSGFMPSEAGSFPGMTDTGLAQNAPVFGAAPMPDPGEAMRANPLEALAQQVHANPGYQQRDQAMHGGDQAFRDQLTMLQGQGNQAEQMAQANDASPMLASLPPQTRALLAALMQQRGGVRNQQ